MLIVDTLHESYGKETADELFSILENDKQTDSVEVFASHI